MWCDELMRRTDGRCPIGTYPSGREICVSRDMLVDRLVVLRLASCTSLRLCTSCCDGASMVTDLDVLTAGASSGAVDSSASRAGAPELISVAMMRDTARSLARGFCGSTASLP
eukprot:scaffold35665_cov112-Isochrysis_galbana.AAC.2